MRSLLAALCGVVLLGTMMCAAPGCDSQSGLEDQPEIKKNPTMNDMPGFNKMQDQLKKDKKIK